MDRYIESQWLAANAGFAKRATAYAANMAAMLGAAVAAWVGRSVDDKRAAHEQFAESFERYLMEGKAPSPELQTLFARFRSWLLNVYKQLRGVPLDPEVRAVMDRMLATDTSRGCRRRRRVVWAFRRRLAKELGLGFVSGVPILRDLASATINGRDYTISPLESASKAIVKATEDAEKIATGQPMPQHVGKDVAQAVGYAVGLPTGQLSQTGSFLWDVYNGNADPQGVKDWYTGTQNGRINP